MLLLDDDAWPTQSVQFSFIILDNISLLFTLS